jgi:hypothetical protein
VDHGADKRFAKGYRLTRSPRYRRNVCIVIQVLSKIAAGRPRSADQSWCATAVIADWDAAVGTESAPRDAQLVASQETVSKLKEAVTKLREENTTLKRKNQAAVTVIAELSAQLQSASGHEPAGTVTPLKKARTQRRHWRS